jgi:hypothetical protein
MKLDYILPQKAAHAEIIRTEPSQRPSPLRAPRVACLLALGHRFEQLVDSGEMRDYADIARLGRVSRARVSQILKLLALAPSIQEYILFLPPRIPGQPRITERDLRHVVREARWDRQREMFARLVEMRTQKVNS